jgi:hypothetical protein
MRKGPTMPTGPQHKNPRIDSVEMRLKARNSAARWRLISIRVGCAAVLIGVSLLSNMVFTGKLGSPRFTETNPERLHQLDQLGEYLTAALASVDQLVSMSRLCSLVCSCWPELVCAKRSMGLRHHQRHKSRPAASSLSLLSAVSLWVTQRGCGWLGSYG